VINSEEFIKFQADQEQLAVQHIELHIHFDSSWNWVRQDALVMYYDIIFGRLTTMDREITARCISLLNCADPDLLTYMQYNIDQCDASKSDTYQLAKQFGQQLIDNTREVIGMPPVYKDGES